MRQLSTVYAFNIIHDCDFDVVKTNAFKNIAVKQGNTIKLPLGKVNVPTCHFTKRTVQLGKSPIPIVSSTATQTEVSASSLSGEYTWKVTWNLQTGNITSFSSSTYYLCVIPTPEAQPQLSGTNFIYLGTTGHQYEYLAKDVASFVLSPPDAICPHFTVKKYLFICFLNEHYKVF